MNNTCLSFIDIVRKKMTDLIDDNREALSHWNQDPGRNNKLAVCELGCNEACEDKAIDIFRRWNAEMIRRKKLTKKPRQKV